MRRTSIAVRLEGEDVRYYEATIICHVTPLKIFLETRKLHKKHQEGFEIILVGTS